MISAVARRARSPQTSPLETAVAETRSLVDQLLAERRRLQAENLRLRKEVERLSEGWETLRKLARGAPHRSRRSH